MKELPPLDSQAADPWMFFGSYARSEVEGAAILLRKRGILFEIREEKRKQSYPPRGWTGHFALWIRDEHTEAAQELLLPYFAEAQNGA